LSSLQRYGAYLQVSVINSSNERENGSDAEQSVCFESNANN